MDELELAAELERKPLSDANGDAPVEPNAVVPEIVQVLRCVDTHVDLAPRLGHFVARAQRLLRK